MTFQDGLALSFKLGLRVASWMLAGFMAWFLLSMISDDVRTDCIGYSTGLFSVLLANVCLLPFWL